MALLGGRGASHSPRVGLMTRLPLGILALRSTTCLFQCRKSGRWNMSRFSEQQPNGKSFRTRTRPSLSSGLGTSPSRPCQGWRGSVRIVFDVQFLLSRRHGAAEKIHPWIRNDGGPSRANLWGQEASWIIWQVASSTSRATSARAGSWERAASILVGRSMPIRVAPFSV